MEVSKVSGVGCAWVKGVAANVVGCKKNEWRQPKRTDPKWNVMCLGRGTERGWLGRQSLCNFHTKGQRCSRSYQSATCRTDRQFTPRSYPKGAPGAITVPRQHFYEMFYFRNCAIESKRCSVVSAFIYKPFISCHYSFLTSVILLCKRWQSWYPFLVTTPTDFFTSTSCK